MSPQLNQSVRLYQEGKLTRRQFIRIAGMLGLSAGSASALLAGCTPQSAPPAAPPPAAEATSVPAAPAAVAAGPKRGGLLKTAIGAPKNLDVSFASSASDHQIAYQWHDQFIDVDAQGMPTTDTSLATGWESNKDATVWDVEVRKGVAFHNGKTMTAKDVVFTYDRIRNPELGAATVNLYKNIQSVEAVDDSHVRFTLDKPNPEFLLDLADYHAMVIDSDVTDHKTQYNGTGPFMIDKFIPEDRITFKRNPNYWANGEDGQALPYVDGMEWLFLGEMSAQVDALQSGTINFLLKLTPEYVSRMAKLPELTVKARRSNWHLAIHMRVDKKPFDDVRVRQAIKLATARDAMLQTVALGYGVPGRDTPIGPAYGDYYLDVAEPQRDVAKAKALLAEAGYKDGVSFELTVQNALGAPTVATVWQEQLKEAGITANIKLIPSDVYYTDVWTTCDAGITDWGPRLYPLPFLQLAYVCGAKWNSAHFCNERLDSLVTEITSEPDRAKRVQMYHEVQKILQEEGGTIVPYYQDQAVVYRNEIKPEIVAPFMPSAVRLERAWIDSK